MLRLGLQIPNFSYPDVSTAELFDRVTAIAQAAEGSGFDTVLAIDHFYQLPMLGPPEEPMLECYSLLSGLAARTETINLSALVTGNTYRNPAMLAKIVTTLDIVSRDRAVLGIGSGWFEAEHIGYGFDFGTVRSRLQMLEEALQIIRPMLQGERPTFSGKHYATTEALNEPQPVRPGGPPIMIGGAGEKVTLRLAATYADASNLNCGLSEIARKIDVLHKHCADVGRDASEVTTSWLGSIHVGETASDDRDRFLAERGLEYEDVKEYVDERVIVGSADEVAAIVQERVIGAGCDGILFNMPISGHDPAAVAQAGETLSQVTAG